VAVKDKHGCSVLARFFVLQKLLSDVLGSTDEAAELFLVAQETAALLDNIAASATRDKDQVSTATHPQIISIIALL
jgi:hypothetical protein